MEYDIIGRLEDYHDDILYIAQLRNLTSKLGDLSEARNRTPGKAKGTLHKGRPQNIWDFWLPPPCPLVVMKHNTKSTQSYYVCFRATPSPLCSVTSFMDGPKR